MLNKISMLIDNWFFEPIYNNPKLDEVEAFMASIMLFMIALIFFIFATGVAVKFLYDFLEITFWRYKGRKYFYHKSKSKRQ